ncbi:phosphoribosylformimino-5-aminoimidazole carboxamide ribotide isomerase [biofilm metagenome]
MHIIPVIDIKNGIAVHAKAGKRDEYLPLQSKLCQSADIFDVINGISQCFHPDIFYLADLNALTHRGNHAGLIKTILVCYPALTFWIDAGYPLPDKQMLNHPNFVPVFGSESFLDDTVNDIYKIGNNFILSLDFSTAGELGASTLFTKPELWPQRVIIMNLPRVGSNQGPDLDQLMAYQNRYPDHTFIAAGGVRYQADLIELEKIGIHSVLVATALHNGQLNPAKVSKA